MLDRRHFLKVALGTTAVVFLNACSGAGQVVPSASNSPSSAPPSSNAPASSAAASSAGPATGQPLPIGVILPSTGPHANIGQAHQRGYDIAIEEINAKGGINGRPLKPQFEDDTSKPEVSVTAFEKLVQAKVPVVVGPYASANAYAVAGYADKNEVPLIIPTAQADNITQQGYKWVFRLPALTATHSQAFVDFAKAQGYKNIAVIYEKTDYGTSIGEAAKKFAQAAGLNMVAYESYQQGAPDFKPLLSKVQAANPEAIFYAAYLIDATLQVRQSKEIGLAPKAIVGGGGFSDPKFIEQLGPDADNLLASAPWSADAKWPGNPEFVAKYKQRFQTEPPYHAAQAYQAMYVAADALKRASAIDPAKVREALTKTDMNTAAGPVKFNAAGDNANVEVLYTQILKGRFVTVYPKSAAAAPIVLPFPGWTQR